MPGCPCSSAGPPTPPKGSFQHEVDGPVATWPDEPLGRFTKSCSVPPRCFPKRAEETLSILVVFEDTLPAITAIHDVIHRAGVLDALVMSRGFLRRERLRRRLALIHRSCTRLIVTTSLTDRTEDCIFSHRRINNTCRSPALVLHYISPQLDKTCHRSSWLRMLGTLPSASLQKRKELKHE